MHNGIKSLLFAVNVMGCYKISLKTMLRQIW